MNADSFGLEICNGKDCANPPYDPSKTGPVPSTGKSPDPKPSGSIFDIFRGKGKKDLKCSDRQPTYATCMSCCTAEAAGGRGTGNACRVECMKKKGYPDNPYGTEGLGLLRIVPPAMCTSSEG
jgi:hypothetical protein